MSMLLNVKLYNFWLNDHGDATWLLEAEVEKRIDDTMWGAISRTFEKFII